MSSENQLILDKSKNNMKKTILEIINCSLFVIIFCGLLWSLKYSDQINQLIISLK
jgi:hypothetical protein